ncbi:hypothetical protein GT037_009061 [Alternaria burnsii]|uniref:Uncharacterized protein n=1 Tax=Alternaria burnsii TaxID=1187904 RepID=A0A8H7AYM4_9PLEO|nr:uncharacterized protein GT037_009061 [Alternaria burnsii]KAF7673110.1 hypothetical protein GT037_009061 [Alternaria burnsii]
MNLNTGLTGAADLGDDFIFGANSTLCVVSNYKKKLIVIRTGGQNIEILAGDTVCKYRWGLA